MRRRINITLPEETLRLIDRVTKKGDRSRVIDMAVTGFLSSTSRANLRKRLKEGYVRWAERDRRLAEEWFAVEEEAWHRTRE